MVSFFLLPPRAHSETIADNVINNNTLPTATHIATTTNSINTGTIKYYAQLYGVNYDLAKGIAYCESQYDPTVDNKYSSASGLFQFLDGTWKTYAIKHWGTTKGHSVYNYADSADLGVWVIAHYGTGDWDASKGCWG